MEKEKSVDESWKESVSDEKEVDSTSQPVESQPSQDSSQDSAQDAAKMPEANFVNYVSSLSFQTLIFLGDLPSPLTNKIEKNYQQAKFIIDTLVMMKEKTQGNLTDEESKLLEASVYELQMKYVDYVKKEEQQEQK